MAHQGNFILYAGAALIVTLFILETFFPTVRFSFDFRASGATRSPLLDPRSPDGSSLENGRIGSGSALITNFAALGTYSKADARAFFEDDSSVPESLSVSFRRSYRSFLYPVGDPVTGFPPSETYRIGDTYYELFGGTLYPFVSEGAFLSRYPREKAESADAQFLARYPVSETWRGYRNGSLLSFADGVFVVTSDTVARPIGSADIFLGLGYRFEDVIPVSAEEVGIYERGRIFLLGAAHPDGTLFVDTDSDTHYIIENGTKRPLTDSPYRSFLLQLTTPIQASGGDSEKKVECTLAARTFHRGLACQVDLALLSDNMGNDYEATFSGNQEVVELGRLTTVSLHTAMDRENQSKAWEKISARESILTERERRGGRISEEFAEREKKITERENHLQQVRETQDKQVKREMDRARAILEEAKAIQIKNKKQ